MELEKEILRKVNEAVKQSIISTLTGYNGALSKITDRVISANADKIEGIVQSSFDSFIQDKGFNDAINVAIKDKFARTLVGSLGGEIESRISRLKQNPSFKATLDLKLIKLVEELEIKS
jgi:hypothetical protein